MTQSIQCVRAAKNPKQLCTTSCAAVSNTPKLYLCLKPFLKEYFGRKSFKGTTLWSRRILFQV